ncbi:MAG: cation:proton antiporter [Candidatus Aminicenantia bacterium]
MNVLIIIIFFLLTFFLKNSSWGNAGLADGTALGVGFILIVAFLFGKIITRWKLPMISGFIIGGALCGPYILKLISVQQVKNLQLLDGLALSLIALTAGGELKLRQLRRRFKGIAAITFSQTIFLIIGFVLFVFLAKSLFSFLPDNNFSQILAFSLLLGVLAVATSPSTTIAIITETRAKGDLTDLVLSITIIKDVLVIILFALFLSFARFLTFPRHTFDVSFLLDLLRDIGGSFLFGGIIGAGIIFYLKYIKAEITLFILGISFFSYQISYYFNFHPLLICMVAGFLVENFSAQGEGLINAIENSSLPIYVIFFAISGASLNLNILQNTWTVALLIVVLRASFKFLGTYLGARFSGEEINIQRLSWMGFISQAGVALGMAIIIERTFPQWGAQFKALILAVIAINQIIGPILLQRIIFQAGEAGKKEI